MRCEVLFLINSKKSVFFNCFRFGLVKNIQDRLLGLVRKRYRETWTTHEYINRHKVKISSNIETLNLLEDKDLKNRFI